MKKRMPDWFKKFDRKSKSEMEAKVISNTINFTSIGEKTAENQSKSLIKEEISNTIKEIEIADLIFNHSLDNNLIDAALYSRQSNERRLISLLEIAKREETQENKLLN